MILSFWEGWSMFKDFAVSFRSGTWSYTTSTGRVITCRVLTQFIRITPLETCQGPPCVNLKTGLAVNQTNIFPTSSEINLVISPIPKQEISPKQRYTRDFLAWRNQVSVWGPSTCFFEKKTPSNFFFFPPSHKTTSGSSSRVSTGKKKNNI